jgi:hypothetical protein
MAYFIAEALAQRVPHDLVKSQVRIDTHPDGLLVFCTSALGQIDWQAVCACLTDWAVRYTAEILPLRGMAEMPACVSGQYAFTWTSAVDLLMGLEQSGIAVSAQLLNAKLATLRATCSRALSVPCADPAMDRARQVALRLLGPFDASQCPQVTAPLGVGLADDDKKLNANLTLRWFLASYMVYAPGNDGKPGVSPPWVTTALARALLAASPFNRWFTERLGSAYLSPQMAGTMRGGAMELEAYVYHCSTEGSPASFLEFQRRCDACAFASVLDATGTYHHLAGTTLTADRREAVIGRAVIVIGMMLLQAMLIAALSTFASFNAISGVFHVFVTEDYGWADTMMMLCFLASATAPTRAADFTLRDRFLPMKVVATAAAEFVPDAITWHFSGFRRLAKWLADHVVRVPVDQAHAVAPAVQAAAGAPPLMSRWPIGREERRPEAEARRVRQFDEAGRFLRDRYLTAFRIAVLYAGCGTGKTRELLEVLLTGGPRSNAWGFTYLRIYQVHATRRTAGDGLTDRRLRWLRLTYNEATGRHELVRDNENGMMYTITAMHALQRWDDAWYDQVAGGVALVIFTEFDLASPAFTPLYEKCRAKNVHCLFESATDNREYLDRLRIPAAAICNLQPPQPVWTLNPQPNPYGTDPLIVLLGYRSIWTGHRVIIHEPGARAAEKLRERIQEANISACVNSSDIGDDKVSTVVISTSVGDRSLTFEGVILEIDTGYEIVNHEGRLMRITVTVSTAEQRRWRVGRLGDGHHVAMRTPIAFYPVPYPSFSLYLANLTSFATQYGIATTLQPPRVAGLKLISIADTVCLIGEKLPGTDDALKKLAAMASLRYEDSVEFLLDFQKMIDGDLVPAALEDIWRHLPAQPAHRELLRVFARILNAEPCLLTVADGMLKQFQTARLEARRILFDTPMHANLLVVEGTPVSETNNICRHVYPTHPLLAWEAVELPPGVNAHYDVAFALARLAGLRGDGTDTTRVLDWWFRVVRGDLLGKNVNQFARNIAQSLKAAVHILDAADSYTRIALSDSPWVDITLAFDHAQSQRRMRLAMPFSQPTAEVYGESVNAIMDQYREGRDRALPAASSGALPVMRSSRPCYAAIKRAYVNDWCVPHSGALHHINSCAMDVDSTAANCEADTKQKCEHWLGSVGSRERQGESYSLRHSILRNPSHLNVYNKHDDVWRLAHRTAMPAASAASSLCVGVNKAHVSLVKPCTPAQSHARAALLNGRNNHMQAIRGLRWREGVINRCKCVSTIYELINAGKVAVAWKEGSIPARLAVCSEKSRVQRIYDWVCERMSKHFDTSISSCGIFDVAERHDPVYYHMRLKAVEARTIFFLITGDNIAEAVATDVTTS